MADAIVLAEEKSKLQSALAAFAGALSNLTPEQVPAAFEVAEQLETLAEEIRTRLRDRLLTEVQAEGAVVTDKGTKEMAIGGYKVRAIPTRTGTDPKKLEAKLRALGEDPARLMRMKITYEVDHEKVAQAQATDLLGIRSWLSAVAYDRAFRVQVERG